MSGQTKPSAGALRAARLLDTEGFVFSWYQEQTAEIIDRETGMAELMKVSQSVAGTLRDLGPRYDGLAERLEQAIAKTKGR